MIRSGSHHARTAWGWFYVSRSSCHIGLITPGSINTFIKTSVSLFVGLTSSMSHATAGSGGGGGGGGGKRGT